MEMPTLPKTSGWSDERTQTSTMPTKQSQPASTGTDPLDKLPAELRLEIITFLEYRGNVNHLCEASPIFYRQRKTDSLLVAWDAMYKNFKPLIGCGYRCVYVLPSALRLANLMWYCAHKPQMFEIVEAGSIYYYPTLEQDPTEEHLLDLDEEILWLEDKDPLFTGREYLIFELDALWNRMITWQLGRLPTFCSFMEEHKRLDCYTPNFRKIFGRFGETIVNSLPPKTSRWRSPVLLLLLVLELMDSTYFADQPQEGSWEWWVETEFWPHFVPWVFREARTAMYIFDKYGKSAISRSTDPWSWESWQQRCQDPRSMPFCYR